MKNILISIAVIISLISMVYIIYHSIDVIRYYIQKRDNLKCLIACFIIIGVIILELTLIVVIIKSINAEYAEEVTVINDNYIQEFDIILYDDPNDNKDAYFIYKEKDSGKLYKFDNNDKLIEIGV